MGAGVIGLIVFFLLLLAGTPLVTGILMKLIWRLRGRKDYLESRLPYYKDPYWFIPCLILSVAVVSFIAKNVLIALSKWLWN